jgi:Mini-chromosome maintenance replisome factor
MATDDFGEEIPTAPSPFSIHAIYYQELPHNNPLLLDILQKDEQYSCEEIRSDLLKLLTQFMLGDEVAAHYVLLHLISNVYARVSGEVLGKFSINLTCAAIPKDILEDLIKKFYNLIELLMPDSFYLPLTIENLNNETFVPKKDYKTNRLQTGLLQLPKHAHLVLDETKLENGKLEQGGCLAVADLSELINSQQLNYDFQFYKIPFQTNIPIMILSEGKSLLPVRKRFKHVVPL